MAAAYRIEPSRSHCSWASHQKISPKDPSIMFDFDLNDDRGKTTTPQKRMMFWPLKTFFYFLIFFRCRTKRLIYSFLNAFAMQFCWPPSLPKYTTLFISRYTLVFFTAILVCSQKFRNLYFLLPA